MHWVVELASYYRIPDRLALTGDLEADYREVRALCEGTYAETRTEHYMATRRAKRDTHTPPGINFLLGASAEERGRDALEARRAANAARDLAAAEARMDEYDAWTRYKFLLAVLTGRYDGAPMLSWRGRPTYGVVAGYPDEDALNEHILLASSERGAA